MRVGLRLVDHSQGSNLISGLRLSGFPDSVRVWSWKAERDAILVIGQRTRSDRAAPAGN